MDIKQRKIYHCSTESAVREFLSLCKKQGYSWKNDKEIDVERDVSLYNTYEAETCFKTNTGKLSFGALSGYQEKEPDREITEFLPLPPFDVIYKCFNFDCARQTIIQLYIDGYSASLQGTRLTAREFITVAESQSDGSGIAIVADNENKRLYVSTIRKMLLRGYGDFVDPQNNIPPLPNEGDVIKLKGSDDLFIVMVSNPYSIFSTAQDCKGRSRIFTVDEVLPTGEVEVSDGFAQIKVGDYFFNDDRVYRCSSKNALYIMADIEFSKSYPCRVIRNGKFVFFANEPIEKADGDTSKIPFKMGDYVRFDGRNFVVDKVSPWCIDVFTEGGSRYSFSIQEFEKKNPKKIDVVAFNPAPDALVMQESKLGELCEKARKVFIEHGYLNASTDGVMAWLKKWNKEKGWLASILRKHHGWSEKDLCVTDLFEENRTGNQSSRRSAVRNFFVDIYNAQCGATSTFYEIFTTAMAQRCCDTKTVSADLKQFVEEKLPLAKISVGAKLTRAIRQVCVAYGLDKVSVFEKSFAKLSDAFSDNANKRRWCLSINPIDFLLMSNGNSWSSCHFLEYGNSNKCYQAGTMSYAVDKVTMIFFTVGSLSAEQDLCMQPKLHRQLFMYSGDYLLQSRLYPDYMDTGYSESTRKTVMSAIAECEDKKDKWIEVLYDVESSSSHYFSTSPFGLHYKDYVYSYHINIAIAKNAKRRYDDDYDDSFENPTIGGAIFCPSCGKEHHTDTHYCYCNDCKH